MCAAGKVPGAEGVCIFSSSSSSSSRAAVAVAVARTDLHARPRVHSRWCVQDETIAHMSADIAALHRQLAAARACIPKYDDRVRLGLTSSSRLRKPESFAPPLPPSSPAATTPMKSKPRSGTPAAAAAASPGGAPAWDASPRRSERSPGAAATPTGDAAMMMRGGCARRCKVRIRGALMQTLHCVRRRRAVFQLQDTQRRMRERGVTPVS